VSPALAGAADSFYRLWFAVRYVHVASVALLAGGAMMIAASALVPRGGRADDALLSAASLYEFAFWLMIGIVVATGVSNLGLKGEGLMGPWTAWGRALTTKLGAVILLLALSLVRSDFVIRCGAATSAAGVADRGRAILGALYAATVAMLLGALWLGLGLAHGRY
jgi:hypothetical protein